MKYLCIHIFKVKFNLSLKICTCDKILCENTPLDFHCVEEKVFLIKIISMIVFRQQVGYMRNIEQISFEYTNV